MDNQIQLFNNPRYGKVSGYLDENGTAWLDAEDVARGLGFGATCSVMKSYCA